MSEVSGKAVDPTDIHVGDWIDRWLPRWAEPYARRARLDRPVGTWLLLFPGWWGRGRVAARVARSPTSQTAPSTARPPARASVRSRAAASRWGKRRHSWPRSW